MLHLHDIPNRPGTRFPGLGTQIPDRWEQHSQSVGTCIICKQSLSLQRKHPLL
ncbi:hypothetical protein HMPREF9137_0058 [Prevotella denticola F0289]|nr:hypothetical protein HMPREF9137_0058 [Prevotella denticola F0289]